MGRSRQYAIMGYGPAVNGSRRVFHASTLVEAYQATVRAARDNVRIVEWTFHTESGRKMLGLRPGEYYVKAEDLERPRMLQKCPRCAGNGCERCLWSGETTVRKAREAA